MAEDNIGRHYFVTEGLFGEQPVWRVVRGETNARGVEMLSFICGCATQRAALAMARAMGEYRACDDTPFGCMKEKAPVARSPQRHTQRASRLSRRAEQPARR